jgi:hypothetical protein
MPAAGAVAAPVPVCTVGGGIGVVRGIDSVAVGTGVQTGSGVGLGATVAVGAEPSSGPLMATTVGVTVGDGGALGDGDTEGEVVRLVVGSGVGVTQFPGASAAPACVVIPPTMNAIQTPKPTRPPITAAPYRRPLCLCICPTSPLRARTLMPTLHKVFVIVKFTRRGYQYGALAPDVMSQLPCRA